MTITTRRLDLIPATLGLLEAELKGRRAFQRLLGFKVPVSWPPDLYDRDATEYTIECLKRGPEQAGWWLYYIMLRPTNKKDRLLTGTAGYKGPPATDGSVELGYGVLPEFRRRGIASEAVAGLVERAFKVAEVQSVIADTLPQLTPSINLLRKLGFRQHEGFREEGVIRFEMSRHDFGNR